MRLIVGLLDIDDDTLCMKLLQLITNVAEDPEGMTVAEACPSKTLKLVPAASSLMLLLPTQGRRLKLKCPPSPPSPSLPPFHPLLQAAGNCNPGSRSSRRSRAQRPPPSSSEAPHMPSARSRSRLGPTRSSRPRRCSRQAPPN